MVEDESIIVGVKARLKVDFAREKALMKVDMKDLELERKIGREDHQVRQRMGGNIEKHMMESGRWALGSVTQNTACSCDEMCSDIDVGRGESLGGGY